MSTNILNLYLLFSRFPREVGKSRRKVYNWDEFMKYIIESNGREDVFVSLYSLDFVIDKVFFEIDAPSIENAFEEAKELVHRFDEYDIPFIPVFSGRRGFHFYLLIKPWNPPNIETAKAILYDLSLQLTEGLKYVDHHCFGDVRRMVRVPCTIHPLTRAYCSFLPRDFIKYNIGDLMKLLKSNEEVDYSDMSKLPDIKRLIDIDYVPSMSGVVGKPLDFGRHSIPSNVLKMLSPLIRPCVWKAIQDPEPSHEVRTEFVSELYWLGYSEDEVLDIIKKLDWRDFDERLTKYHIHKIFSKRLLPMSCSKLKMFVRCTNCKWFYFWNAQEGSLFGTAPGRTREVSRPYPDEGMDNASPGEVTVNRGKSMPEGKFSLPVKPRRGWWYEVLE